MAVIDEMKEKVDSENQRLKKENNSVLQNQARSAEDLRRIQEENLEIKDKLSKIEQKLVEKEEECEMTQNKCDLAISSKIQLICKISNELDGMKHDLHRLPTLVVHKESFTEWFSEQTLNSNEWIMSLFNS